MNRIGHLRRSFQIGLVVLLAPATAVHANVGIPMLGYAWPVAWILLIPVIVLEALVARRILRASWSSSLKIAGLSNFISTLAGIPLAWGAALLVAMVASSLRTVLPRSIPRWTLFPFYAAWLPPLADRQLWLLPAAGALLCIPFFLASVWIERRVAQRFAGFQSTDIRRWAWRANLVSYSLIAGGLAITALIVGLRQ